MGNLHFITVSSNPELALKDHKSRRLIRSTATRATRSQRVNELSEKHQIHSDQVRETPQRKRMTRFRAKLGSSVSANKQATLTTTSTTLALRSQVSIWDPVVAPLGDQAWTLLHYYRYRFRACSWAINAKRDWFAFIIEDQSATHATLAFVSLNRDLEEGSAVSASTLHHRAKALQLVRQQLNSTNASVDDSTIGAVALLAIAEGLEGHSSLSTLHVQALKRLVDIRGGLHKLRGNEALSRLIAWADLCHTSTFLSLPRLPKLFKSSDLFPNIDNSPSDFHKIVQDTMLPEMYELVRLLAAVPRYAPSDGTSVDQRQAVSRLIYCISKLVWSIYHNGPAFGTDFSGRLAKVLWCAICLYISLVLRRMPRRTIVVTERAQKLYASIQELEYIAFLDIAQEELYLLVALWTHTVYFCSLLPHERNGIVTTNLMQIMTQSQISDAESLKNRLGQIHWVNEYAGDDLERLCYECYR